MTARQFPGTLPASTSIGPREAAAVALAVAAVVGLATLTGQLAIIAVVAAGAVGIAVLAGDPRWVLFAYVALIPVDGLVLPGGAGTLARFAGIAFAVLYLAKRRGRLRLDPIGALGWAFALFAAASFLWAADRTAAQAQLLTFAQLFVLAVLVADLVAEDPRFARVLALVYAAGALVVSCIGLFAWVTNRSALPAGRAVAFDGQDPAQFSAILVPALFVLTWELLRRPNLLALGGAAILTLGIVASGTRSAWVAVAVIMAIGLVPRMTARQRSAGLVAVVLVGLVILVVPALNELTIGRLAAVIESGGTGRTDIWAIGLRVWADAPLFGVGYGGFPGQLTLETIRATDVPTIDTGFLEPPIGSHSIVFGTLVELGVIGLLLLAGFLLQVLRPWEVLHPRRGGDEMLQMARLACLAVFSQALFLDILGRKQVWLFVALAAGLGAAALTASRTGRPDPGAAAAATTPAPVDPPAMAGTTRPTGRVPLDGP